MTTSSRNWILICGFDFVGKENLDSFLSGFAYIKRQNFIVSGIYIKHKTNQMKFSLLIISCKNF